MADAIDMAGNDMAAQLVAGLERALQVDALAGLPVAQRRLAQRLVGDIDREPRSPSGGRDSVAVRQAPSQAIEAPTAMPAAA